MKEVVIGYNKKTESMHLPSIEKIAKGFGQRKMEDGFVLVPFRIPFDNKELREFAKYVSYLRPMSKKLFIDGEEVDFRVIKKIVNCKPHKKEKCGYGSSCYQFDSSIQIFSLFRHDHYTSVNDEGRGLLNKEKVDSALEKGYFEKPDEKIYKL
ncbi:hypothetical protein KKA03_02905, partial [archaeon]|nr:hypothetical protein [archaeon]